MAAWQLQEAKAKLSELIEETDRSGPQIITKHGKNRAVVLSFAEYERLRPAQPDSFVAYLLSGPKFEDFEIERDKDTGREIDFD